MTNTTDYPDTYEATTNWTYYKISNGKLTTGSDLKGTKQKHDSVIGVLERIGEHESEYGGDMLTYIEIELLHKDGSRSNISVNQGSATACLWLCKKLLGCAKGEAIAISVDPSKEPSPKGWFASFTNISAWRPTADGSFRWHEVLGEEFDGNNSREKLVPCLEALQEHPAWADRAKREEDQPSTPTAMSLTNKAVVNKGWPSLLQATPAYLRLIEKACKVKYANYADVPDTVWEQFTANLDKAKAIPGALQEVLDKLKTDDYDPFGDE